MVFDGTKPTIYISVVGDAAQQFIFEKIYRQYRGRVLKVEDNIEKLEQRITDMIELCEKMSRENEILKNDQQMLRQEFTSLQEKNKIARGRVEQIVARLKSLESWSAAFQYPTQITPQVFYTRDFGTRIFNNRNILYTYF